MLAQSRQSPIMACRSGSFCDEALLLDMRRRWPLQNQREAEGTDLSKAAASGILRPQSRRGVEEETSDECAQVSVG